MMLDDLLLNVLFPVMMYVLYSAFLDKKVNWGFLKISILIIINALIFNYGTFIIYELIPEMSMVNSLMQLLKTVIMCILMLCPFKGQIYKKIFLVIFMLFIMTLSEQLALLAIASLKGISVAETIQLNIIDDIMRTASIVIYAAAVMLIKIFRRKRNVIEKPPLLYVLELMIPIIGNLLYIAAFFILEVNNIILFTAFMLSINIVIFFIYDKLEQDFMAIQRYEVENQQYMFRQEYYQEVEQNQKEIRTIKHNLKNQLIALKAVADSGDKAEAIQAISKLEKSIIE